MRIAREKFIADIAGYVKKYAGLYGILVFSPVIAQAVLESGWGESRLASQYHNYFGLKCGTRWTGRSVNMQYTGRIQGKGRWLPSVIISGCLIPWKRA